ncbi:hypothetical protein KSP40_PGU018913 [Platanthera guangdongensis]|uniref:Uncharacterized protein n=1 Tax=Platanthera guangdongensis TaxID=2320717 RepID=A0ABR2MEX2_9ASPA
MVPTSSTHANGVSAAVENAFMAQHLCIGATTARLQHLQFSLFSGLFLLGRLLKPQFLRCAVSIAPPLHTNSNDHGIRCSISL